VRADQTVSEMAVEVLARQAQELAARTGQPLWEAYEEVAGAGAAGGMIAPPETSIRVPKRVVLRCSGLRAQRKTPPLHAGDARSESGRNERPKLRRLGPRPSWCEVHADTVRGVKLPARLLAPEPNTPSKDRC
jgi:hypothetical protein